MFRLRLKFLAAVALVSIVAVIVTACGDDEQKPFSLGGDSQVVGFTPTPTARFPKGPEASPAHETPTVAPTGGGPTTPPPTGGGGNVAAGRQVFLGAGCTGCHTVQGVPGATGSVGPNLTRIGTVAETRIAGKTAEQYIKESIETPNAFAASGYTIGVMPSGLVASGANLDNLVAFLLTLK